VKACSDCHIFKPYTEYAVDRRNGNRMAKCKSCRSRINREWRKRQPDYEKIRYQKDKVAVRERHLRRKYGVDLAEYGRLLVDQGGCCAICGAAERDQFKSVFHVDHCHKTGEVRGLLCRGCNHMLGVVSDDPTVLQRAIGYLTSRKSRRSSSGRGRSANPDAV
jgi:hypothetical protein